MATIATIEATDVIATSRTDINTNFANLNLDKIETSFLDSDTSLTANSDSKIPTQKAVKAYVDSGGQANASETVRGLVEEATSAEVTAGTDTGGTGAKLFVPPSKMNTQIDNKISSATILYKNGSTTYDMSTASGVQNIAHGLGKIPKFVTIKAVLSDLRTGSPDSTIASTETIYNGTTQSSLNLAIHTDDATNQGISIHGSDFRIYAVTTGTFTNYQTGVVTFDATNIIITWTKTSTPTGTANLMWGAQA